MKILGFFILATLLIASCGKGKQQSTMNGTIELFGRRSALQYLGSYSVYVGEIEHVCVRGWEGGTQK